MMTSDKRQHHEIPRGEARLAAVQALYQMELSGGDANDVITEFIRHRFANEISDVQYVNPDIEHFSAVVRGVVEHQVDIDKYVNGALADGWALRRLDSTLRALMRAATFELVVRTSIPARVVINEYVEIAHAFFHESEPAFVNGALDKIARAERADEFERSGEQT